MVNARVANQDRSLCDPVAPRAVFWASIDSVLIIEAATGTVKFKNVKTHRSSKSMNNMEEKDTGNSSLDKMAKVNLALMCWNEEAHMIDGGLYCAQHSHKRELHACSRTDAQKMCRKVLSHWMCCCVTYNNSVCG